MPVHEGNAAEARHRECRVPHQRRIGPGEGQVGSAQLRFDQAPLDESHLWRRQVPISRYRFVFDTYQFPDQTRFAQYASLRKRSGMREMKLKFVISTAETLALATDPAQQP